MFDRLEASFKNVRRFAADASHELKTPLSLIRLHAEKLLAAGTLSHEGEEGVQTLLEELTRVNGTIDELLFLSRAEARSITLDLSPHDPAGLLANFNVDAQVLAEHHGVHFSSTHEGSGLAICEPRWVRRVLLESGQQRGQRLPAGGQHPAAIAHGRRRCGASRSRTRVPASRVRSTSTFSTVSCG